MFKFLFRSALENCMTSGSCYENNNYSRDLEVMTDRGGGLLFYCPKKGEIIYITYIYNIYDKYSVTSF